VTSFYRCLLQQLASSKESRHFSWDKDPANTMVRRLIPGPGGYCFFIRPGKLGRSNIEVVPKVVNLPVQDFGSIVILFYVLKISVFLFYILEH
jgi:hypothetical protein